MKRIAFYLFSLLLVFILACTKEKDDPTDEKTNKDLLINKTWKFQKLTLVENNSLIYYVRGGSSNSLDFSNDAIIFLADGTGTYTTTQNVSFTIAWQFIDAEQTTIRYTIFNYDNGVIRQGVNLLITWENVQLSMSSLDYAEIYTKNTGRSIIGSAKRIAL